MAASSSSSAFFGGREGDAMKLTHHQHQQQQPPPQQPPQLQPQQPQLQLQQQHSLAVPPPSSSAPPTNPQQKKKRSLPGTPSKYPDAEVIALSPKTLMATNRFICEVCNKGFQREQNLQLHRRGHNLPWKLRQKTKNEIVKKKVYLCPEPTCVHHDPARALGDLTGIKKHYSRKHGEKKFKCEKCSKRYAVQSDWKAHSKTCGTREYRCDCGTLFSRRDSFITHRAFCDALAQESARHPTSLATLGSHLFGSSGATIGGNNSNNNMGLGVGLSHQMANHHLPTSLSDQMTSDILRLGGGGRGMGTGQFDHLLGPNSFRQQPNMQQSQANFYLSDQSGGPNHYANTSTTNNDQENQSQNAGGGIFSNKLFPGQLPVHDLGFFSNNNNNNENTNTINTSNNTNGSGDHSGLFSPTGSGSLFGGQPSGGGLSSLYTTGPALQASPHMSATALLQKAAQMGSTTSTNNASATALLKGLDTKPITQQQSISNPPPTSGGGGYAGLFGENDQNNLHELLMRDNLMNNPFFGQDHQTGATGDHNSNYGGFNPNKSGLGVGSSDRLTRDFLGVGEIVRSMSGGGFTANSQNMASLDNVADHQRNNSTTAANNNSTLNNSAPSSSSQAFGGGNNF
ncbi:protein indeterminate-domain 5, chloroplastic isoform X1 [Beta vulgaris subsp. vulgaris]|uniref:protein indeterminate-domain 5, chloroplastic isoform X1 n=1 Tax=Beta vulgaris subsp. vulgaris TaxID=3555 RepID=UPI00203762AD|nr:protein indeterminate-domain 5, chloroplastic isoform X1 [Beta vulgaris subsp. vulgaris]